MPARLHYTGDAALVPFGPSLSSLKQKGTTRRVYEAMRIVALTARHLQRAVRPAQFLWASVLADGPGGWAGRKKKSGVLAHIGV